MSTFYNQRYAQIEFIDIVELINKFVPEYTVDLFNPKLQRLIRRLTVFKTHVLQANEKITTLSYQTYGTTTLWWIIVIASGLIHPYEAVPGTLILLPDIYELGTVLNDLKTANQSSKVVVI